VAKMCISGRIGRLERLAATRPVPQAPLAPLTETRRALRVVQLFRMAAERGGLPWRDSQWPAIEQRLATTRDPVLALEVLRLAREATRNWRVQGGRTP
jgi:hypothetical protein